MKKHVAKNAAGKTGPKPDTIKIEGDWEAAVDKALQKKRPKDGWPKPEKKKRWFEKAAEAMRSVPSE